MSQKGSYQYMKKRRKKETIKTVILYSIAIAIFLIGYITTKTRNNLCTVFAVLMVLPASKAVVGLIMLYRFPLISERLISLIKPFESTLTVLYDLIFTSREKAMKLDCLVICDNTVIGYSAQEKLSDKETAKYLNNYLSNQGKENVSVKIYKSEQSFLEQLETLSYLSIVKEDEAELLEKTIKELLLGFSM